jgi:putative ABC transport system permease protein
VWRLALRDLVWRRRRFAIAVLATALVFAITLLLSGFSAAIDTEPGRIVRLIGADSWVVQDGTVGPFNTTQLVPAATVDAVGSTPGVAQAEGIVVGHTATRIGGTPIDFNVLGVQPGGMVRPHVVDGVALSGDGQAVVDERSSAKVGDQLQLGSVTLSVVGRASGVSFNFGIITVFMTIGDAQKASFAGQPFVTAVITKGVPPTVPAGFRAEPPAQVTADLKRPLVQGLQTISFVAGLLWVVAAGIVGSIVYLTALERTRDFAVLKATGASNGALFVSLGVQALVLSGSAAIVAVGLGTLLTPAFPMEVTVQTSSFVALVVLALIVAVVGSAFGLRRAITVDPALAFGG